MKSQIIQRRVNSFCWQFKFFSDSLFTKCQAAIRFQPLSSVTRSVTGLGGVGPGVPGSPPGWFWPSSLQSPASSTASHAPVHCRQEHWWAWKHKHGAVIGHDNCWRGTNIHPGFVYTCSCRRLFGLTASVRGISRNQLNTKDSHCNIITCGLCTSPVWEPYFVPSCTLMVGAQVVRSHKSQKKNNIKLTGWMV